jgi:hypothetical protein
MFNRWENVQNVGQNESSPTAGQWKLQVDASHLYIRWNTCLIVLSVTSLQHWQLKLEVYIHLGWSHYKSFFNHSTNVLLTNYSLASRLGHLLCAWHRIIFPTIVYRQIISHIIHCITIPVGQKFTCTKFTVPLNSLENSRKVCHGLRSFW